MIPSPYLPVRDRVGQLEGGHVTFDSCQPPAPPPYGGPLAFPAASWVPENIFRTHSVESAPGNRGGGELG